MNATMANRYIITIQSSATQMSDMPARRGVWQQVRPELLDSRLVRTVHRERFDDALQQLVVEDDVQQMERVEELAVVARN